MGANLSVMPGQSLTRRGRNAAVQRRGHFMALSPYLLPFKIPKLEVEFSQI